MDRTDRFQLDAIARALTAYENAAAADPELAARLDLIGVPNGFGVATFARDARRLRGKFPAQGTL